MASISEHNQIRDAGSSLERVSPGLLVKPQGTSPRTLSMTLPHCDPLREGVGWGWQALAIERQMLYGFREAPETRETPSG